MQLETGDQAAAAASLLQALTLFRDLGNLFGQAQALDDLGIVQQEAGDYPAAAASHQQALRLVTDLGNQLRARLRRSTASAAGADRGHRASPRTATPGPGHRP